MRWYCEKESLSCCEKNPSDIHAEMTNHSAQRNKRICPYSKDSFFLSVRIQSDHQRSPRCTLLYCQDSLNFQGVFAREVRVRDAHHLLSRAFIILHCLWVSERWSLFVELSPLARSASFANQGIICLASRGEVFRRLPVDQSAPCGPALYDMNLLRSLCTSYAGPKLPYFRIDN